MDTAFELLKNKESARVDVSGEYIDIYCTDGEILVIEEESPEDEVRMRPFEETEGFNKPVRYKCDVIFDRTNRATDFLPRGVCVMGDIRIEDCKSHIRLEKGEITGKLNIYRENSITLSDFSVSEIFFGGEGSLTIRNEEEKEFETIELENKSIRISNSKINKLVVRGYDRDFSRFSVYNSTIKSFVLNPSLNIAYFSLRNSSIYFFESEGFADIKSIGRTGDTSYFPENIKDLKSKREFNRLYAQALNNKGDYKRARKFEYNYRLNRDKEDIFEGNLIDKFRGIRNIFLKGSWGYGYHINSLFYLCFSLILVFSGFHFVLTYQYFGSVEIFLSGPYIDSILSSFLWAFESFIPTSSVNDAHRSLSLLLKMVGLFCVTMFFAYAKEEIR